MALDPLVRTYDPKLNIVTFGTILMSGFAEGDAITISQPDDSFELIRGSDGTIDRVNKNILHVVVEINLKSTSPVNDLLSIIHKNDKLTNGGKLPLIIKDLNSAATLLTAPQAWIVKPADVTKSDSIGTFTWTFHTGIADYNPSGNLV